ncbi:MAG: FAD-dependent oxidoreductase, partial [Phenylobacterium sp.]
MNCPLDRDQYESFIDALLAGPKAEFKDWENVPSFDGCLPIEVMAERGRETLRHGPMKPVGLLHAEMRALDSIIMSCGDAHQVPAGGALAVDREGFAEAVTARLLAHPNITLAREEIAGLPPGDWDSVIIATGPLTSPALAQAILDLTGEGQLAFFDAIAPIVNLESVNMDVAWRQSRYDKEGPGGDAAAYINCPLDRDQYESFIDALLAGPKAEFKDWENVPSFDGCLPI